MRCAPTWTSSPPSLRTPDLRGRGVGPSRRHGWYPRSMPIHDFLAASPESVGVDPQKLEAVFERAAKEVREGLLPSCQIAVARQGKLAGFRSFGQVNCEGRARAAGDDTLYVIF